MKRFVAGLLKVAMQTIYEYEEPMIREHVIAELAKKQTQSADTTLSTQVS
jgi:hypothetical protein